MNSHRIQCLDVASGVAFALLFSALFAGSGAAQTISLEAGVARADGLRTAVHGAALVGVEHPILSLQMGVSFQPQGVVGTSSSGRFGEVGFDTRETVHNLNYVGMPLRVKTFFSRKKRTGFFGRAGVEPRVLLNNQPGPPVPPNCEFCYEPISRGQGGLYPSWDLGMQLGLGWSFENAAFPFFAEVTGSLGLREMPRLGPTTGELGRESETGRNSSLLLVLGRSFSL